MRPLQEADCHRPDQRSPPTRRSKTIPRVSKPVKRCFGPRERRPLATKDQKFASLTNDLFIFYDLTGAVARNSRPGGRVAPPGSHFPRKAMAHAEQPWACAPAINIASSRRPSKPVERLRTHHSTDRLAACKHAGSTPHTSNYERTAARADPAHDTPGSLTCDKPEGGHVRRGGAAGAAGAPACHQSARSSTARPSGPSRTSARAPILADRDGAHAGATPPTSDLRDKWRDQRSNRATQRLEAVLKRA